ncbi:MAG: glycosyltransferase family 4 protein [Planctomycetota bacterium]
MTAPLRVLTVGMKTAVNEALAAREDLAVSALAQGVTERRTRGRLDEWPYELRPKISLRASSNVRAAIRTLRPDIVQTYGSRPLAQTIVALGLGAGRPKLLSYRGITSTPSRLRAEDWLTYLSPRVDAHACESLASRDGLVAGGVDAASCFIAYNCLTRRPAAAASREALDRWKIPRDAFVVVMVANMRPVKGADVLLEAAAHLTDLPNVYFLLMGEVRDRRVEQLAADPMIAPRVRLTGYFPGAMDVMSTADVFAAPSRAEALCVALLEAMSAGVCPVVSDAGGMKEAVRDGVDGLVVPREDPGGLAAAIRRLVADRDLLRRLAGSARERQSAEFSGERVAERFALAYRRIADGAALAAA